jgi:hypothetical protein
MISKKVANKSPIMPQPEKYVPLQTEKYVPPQPDISSIIPEPGFNYSIQIENMEQRLSEINDDIQKGLVALYEQHQQSKVNEQVLQDQTVAIETNKEIIDNNSNVINQQISAYNHNTNIIAQQCNQINGMNVQIQNLTNLLTVLQNDTATKQTTLYEVQKQLEDAQNQLGLHGTMLNAFNMMLQNPQYFMQMMSITSQYMYNPHIFYEDISYEN